ncbi:uncharacterized protein [Linepithema humile]|uniref:uncharacterized protein n=1 Tax=Linepithema humile TaxID=83485 RepID=UPI0006235A6F|nr:PREDICTED: uncharacterized protein LOC105675353 [Linepithema humile]XP_012227966.1 PREDICTED: uncharacterized protein LOC105675353 [Linepithema humile]
MAYILSKIPILCQTAFHKNIRFKSAVKMISIRNCHITNRTNPMAEQRFKLKDNISSDYKLIYREHKIVNFVTIVAYTCGWLGLTAGTMSMGYLIYKNPPLQQEGIKDGSGKEILKPLSQFGRITAICASITLSILAIIASKVIPFRIYHNPTEKLYKAIFVSNALGKAQILTFGEGTVVPKFGRKYIGDLLFDINGYTVLLDKECFPVPYAREQMIRRTV